MLPWLSLLVGLSVAFSARQQIRILRVSWRRGYLTPVLLYESLVLFPAGMFLFIAYPAWSTLYLAEPPSINVTFGFAVMLISVFTSVVGYQLGGFLCRHGSDRILISSIGGGVLGLLAFFVLAGARLGRVAQDGHWRDAPGLMSSSLGITLLATLPVVLSGWIFLVVLFEAEGRKIARFRSVLADDIDGTGTQEPGFFFVDHATSSSGTPDSLDTSSDIDRDGEKGSSSRGVRRRFFRGKARND